MNWPMPKYTPAIDLLRPEGIFWPVTPGLHVSEPNHSLGQGYSFTFSQRPKTQKIRQVAAIGESPR